MDKFFLPKSDFHNYVPGIPVYAAFLLIFLLFFTLFAPFLNGCTSRQQAYSLPEIAVTGDTRLVARTKERFFEIYHDSQWNPLIVKGINIGTALPGKHFTQFPMDKDIYQSWLEQIADLNANTIRLYTLLDPLFYQAFHEHNRSAELREEVLS